MILSITEDNYNVDVMHVIDIKVKEQENASFSFCSDEELKKKEQEKN